MTDCHFRVGGALFTVLRTPQCPKLTGQVNKDCIAGSMLLHITPWGSAYMENVWGRVADHDLDISEQTQIDIYVGRGALIESIDPTWLYGTAMEHCVLYQYQVLNARKLFMGMIQTESPYYQETPRAPQPFTSALGLFRQDPNFAEYANEESGCAIARGLRVLGSEDIYTYGAGLYSWFSKYRQDCLAFSNCQDRILFADNNSRFFLYNLVTVGTTHMVTAPGAKVLARDSNDKNSNTSSINALLMQAEQADIGGGVNNMPGETLSLPLSF